MPFIQGCLNKVKQFINISKIVMKSLRLDLSILDGKKKIILYRWSLRCQKIKHFTLSTSEVLSICVCKFWNFVKQVPSRIVEVTQAGSDIAIIKKNLELCKCLIYSADNTNPQKYRFMIAISFVLSCLCLTFPFSLFTVYRQRRNFL